ncbi:unnamed protein product, partial [Musa textilis]
RTTRYCQYHIFYFLIEKNHFFPRATSPRLFNRKKSFFFFARATSPRLDDVF